jgi:hypothetical protein
MMEAGDSSKAWYLYTTPHGIMFQKPVIYSYLYCCITANFCYFHVCFLCYQRSHLVKYHNSMCDAILIQFTRRWRCRVSFVLPGIYAFADQWISLTSVGADLWWTKLFNFFTDCAGVFLLRRCESNLALVYVLKFPFRLSRTYDIAVNRRLLTFNACPFI